MTTIIRWAADARQRPMPEEWTQLLAITDRLQAGDVHLATTNHLSHPDWVTLPANMVVSTYEQLVEELRGLSNTERLARRKTHSDLSLPA